MAFLQSGFSNPFLLLLWARIVADWGCLEEASDCLHTPVHLTSLMNYEVTFFWVLLFSNWSVPLWYQLNESVSYSVLDHHNVQTRSPHQLSNYNQDLNLVLLFIKFIKIRSYFLTNLSIDHILISERKTKSIVFFIYNISITFLSVFCFVLFCFDSRNEYNYLNNRKYFDIIQLPYSVYRKSVYREPLISNFKGISNCSLLS